MLQGIRLKEEELANIHSPLMMRPHCGRFSSRSNYTSHSNLDQSPQDFDAIGPHSYFQRIRKTDQEYEGSARVRLHSVSVSPIP